MAITPLELEHLLNRAFPGATIDIQDLVGDGDHYAVHITSEKFASQTRVQQHQMVHEALEGRIGGQLHALSIRTTAPSNLLPTESENK